MSSEWTVDGRTWLTEKLRSAVSDVQAVLQSDAKLTVNRDHRFVAETHARPQRRFVAANEVRPFMAVETDPVSCAMGKSRDFVVRAETGVRNHLARRRVDRFAGHAGLRGVERGHLRALFEVPHVDLAFRRLAEHDGARDVRLITIDHAAVIDLDDVTFLERLRRDAAMGERRVLTEADGDRRTLRAERAVRRQDVVPQIALRHAFAKRGEPGLVGGERHVVGPLHQGDLGRRLDHAAARGDRVGADVLERRRFFLDAVEDEEAKAFFHANAARGDAAIFEDLRDQPVWAVVLLPGPDVFAEPDQLARTGFFERWAYPRQLAFGGNDRDEGTLAQSPPHAREVEQTRSAFEADRADVVVHHQPLRFLETSRSLGVRDRHDAVGHWPKRADRRRNVRSLLRFTAAAGTLSGALRSSDASRERRSAAADTSGGAPLKKLSTMRVHHRPRLNVASRVWWAAPPTGRASGAGGHDR